ncbi:hypothetical protein GCM10010403_22580 [Glycomyces rutgersensis]|nr:hypothetical protein [Glycomyces lechevalierae]
MRDLGKITLARTGSKTAFETQYPLAGPLLTKRLNTDLVAGSWDDLLRVSASVKYGHASAALVVGKLCSSRRNQNTTTAAIKEWGLLRRTIYAARYLADDTYQRRIARQLNKGENVHALRRNVFYAFDGTVRRAHLEQQTEQAWCLTLITNAIVTWTTEYFGLAVARLRHRGAFVDDELLAHIWPTRHANINFFGAITIDVDAEIAELNNYNGHRPLHGDVPADSTPQALRQATKEVLKPQCRKQERGCRVATATLDSAGWTTGRSRRTFALSGHAAHDEMTRGRDPVGPSSRRFSMSCDPSGRVPIDPGGSSFQSLQLGRNQ